MAIKLQIQRIFCGYGRKECKAYTGIYPTPVEKEDMVHDKMTLNEYVDG